ncbi:MAG: InlB B-repeat-containing protein [Clostridiales bacterium]|nr:InlB B-repeat-containing protein [Clostridiales bacterium]
MKLYRNTTSYTARRRSRRGFTLVELVVVLTIIAILAAIGITSVVGYINRSRFDQNNQNAITIYQAAQTAVTQKINNGSMQEWVIRIPGVDVNTDSELTIPADAETNYSTHKKLALTYNPTSGNTDQGAYLQTFLSPYFYDKAIFQGTITVVFDIAAVNDNGVHTYSASVLSVYYSIQNTANVGWDDVCRHVDGDGNYPNGDLPDPDPNYRYTTSYVGYFNGTEESLRPNISPVFLPWSITSEMEGHIIGPSTDPEASGYLFNLRNGETLDVSWAIFDEDGAEHTDHNEYLTIEFYEYSESEEEVSPSSTPESIATITVDYTGSKTSSVVFNEATAQYSYESVDNWDITRLTCYGFAELDVSINGGESTPMLFPMSVTKVIGDGRTGTPRVPGTSADERRTAPYFEYAISLDCLMERVNDSDTENRQYGVYRLFGETPRNIYASISGSCNHYVLAEDGITQTESSGSIPKTFAARAMNDPVYQTGTTIVASRLGYAYSVVPNKGKYDGSDDHSNSNYVITGTGVVNTFFGDAVYQQVNDLDADKTIYYGGTDWSSTGSSAVITSFRHLSNIRWFGSSGSSSPAIDFLIVNNLDWYAHNSVIIDGVRTELYTSQVKVFSANTGASSRKFYSPVNSGKTTDTLYTVSFPALPRITENMTLSSYSHAGGRIYSINNVQMRTASFNDRRDTGYGLICENDGVVYNIYTNNLNLILENVSNGSINDYSKTNQGTLTVDNSGSKPIVLRAIGGLVGYNLGSVGLGGEGVDIAETQNMIVMNNTVIICGQRDGTKWKLGGYDWGTGSVIGLNGGVVDNNGNYTAQTANYHSSTYGVFEVNGTFAIAAKKNAGGIIGRSYSDIGARLVVNDPNIRVPSPEITLPKEANMPQLQNGASGMSCIVTAMNDVGGVIGRIQGAGFTYAVTHQFDPERVSSNPESGVNFNIAGLTGSDYGIDINLPANSLVFEYAGGDDNTAAGGAVGNMINCSGEYLSIRVINSGHVYITRTDKKMYSGGAIGIDDNCTIGTLYIDVNNAANTRIGYRDNSGGPVSAGGAIGVITGNADGRIFAIRAENNGTIIARGEYEGQGAGGAIGATDAGFVADLYINVVNGTSSEIIGLTDKASENYGGVGGAIGGMHRNTGRISDVSVLFVDNSGLIRNRNYAGGVIGVSPVVNGKIYAVDSGRVRAADKIDQPSYFAGGAVGYAECISSTGVVQSILNGATISGRDFIGGAAGRVHNFNNAAVIRTIVKGNSSVTGTGSLVGGICGDVRVTETGNAGLLELVGDSSNPILKIQGVDGVGGVAGLMRYTVNNSVQVKSPDQTTTNRLILHIDGNNSVGGLLGCLRSTSRDDNNVSNLLSQNLTNDSAYLNMSIVLLPDSHIIGTGENVGGAVGAIDSGANSKFGGSIKVSSASGSTASSLASVIRGKKNVGGAIGYINKVDLILENGISGGIVVDFELAPWTIESNASVDSEVDVGGAIGIINGTGGTNGNTYPVTVRLGSSIVKASGYNVGGAVGSSSTRLGVINVTLSGRVEGQYNVGGAIGSNKYTFNSANVNISATGYVEATGSKPSDTNGTSLDRRYDNGSNVGGVVGNYSFDANNNTAITCDITATINGRVIGPGNNVGGAIGYCYSSKNKHLIQNITANIQGAAVIQGADNVGGVSGYSRSNITNVISNISGASKVIGNNRVGGAIGWTYADYDGRGDDVLYVSNTNYANYSFDQLQTALNNSLFKKSGRINSIRVTISADNALEGDTYIGGAVGQSGWKTVASGNHWSSPALIKVEVIMNSAYLFDPFDTGVSGGNACVGGVIGLVVDGRVEEVILSGTGGTVNTDSRYPCPELSENGAVLIAASGQSVGGIIGQIGLESTPTETLTGGNAQNVTVSNISAAYNLHLCVVSMDGSNRIGGWIGSAFGKYGGLGNRSAGDYNNSGKRAEYDVRNVRAVYSRGDYVGGFCGFSRSYGARETYLVVNVNLNDAAVTGRNGVGGAFGMVYGVNFKLGSISVVLSNNTVIGDANGSALCQEAGGAIGSLYQDGAGEGTNPDLAIPITVTIDATSHIWSEGGDDTTSNYGVGGVLGRAYGKFTVSGTLRITAADPNSLTVYSRYSNVGGAVGVMDNVDMSAYTYSSASYASGVSVRSDAVDGCVGGFVGKINSLKADMKYCYCYGAVTVQANGANACAGGFVGYATWNSDTRKIDSCYTTAEVVSSGTYTGGFAGQLTRGTISNCYVGGHTYQGSYVAGEGNITGVGYVGGFCGATSGANNITFNNCYSTASVLGTGEGVGGFIGKTSSKTSITNCYCTGRVNCDKPATTGSFVGVITASDLSLFTGNQVMRDVNPGNYPLVGTNWTSTVGAANVVYADDTVIRGSNNNNAVPFDTPTLTTTFGLRAVVNGTHYGDWPLPNHGSSIDDATVQLYLQVGVDPEGNPQYDWVDFTDGSYSCEFNGSAIEFDTAKIKVLIQGEPIPSSDYSLAYRRNDRVGTATVIISANPGNPDGYTGALSRNFRIDKADISGVEVTFVETSHEYTGARIVPTLTVTYNGVALQRNTDYYLAYDRDGDIGEGYDFDNDNISIGEMYVYVIGLNNYTGVKVCDQKFTITAIDLSNLTLEDVELIGADNLVYDEINGVPVAHCPEVVVRYGGNTLIGTHDPEAPGCDYVITYSNNVNASTPEEPAYLIVTGTADESIGTGEVYTGSYRIPFNIAPAVNSWITESTLSGWTYSATPYDPVGAPKFGVMSWEFYDSEGNVVDDIDAASVGSYYAMVSVAPSGNYSSPTPIRCDFAITPADITDRATAATDSPKYPYTGSEITPVLTVTVPKLSDLTEIVTLEENVDYTVTYTGDRINPGTVTVTVTGIGNYSGTASCQFTIYREFAIRFYSNGEQYGDTQMVLLDSQVVRPEVDPSRGDTYRFDGWFADSACTQLYNFETPVEASFDLYAGWTRIWTVRFETYGGTVIADQQIPDGETLSPVEEPVRIGYYFRGWYVDSGYTNPFTDWSIPITRDYTLYAKWETAPSLTVSFDSNGGSAVEDQIVDYMGTATSVTPTREGYTFSGWFTPEGSQFDFSTPITTDIVLTAHWDEDE